MQICLQRHYQLLMGCCVCLMDKLGVVDVCFLASLALLIDGTGFCDKSPHRGYQLKFFYPALSFVFLVSAKTILEMKGEEFKSVVTKHHPTPDNFSDYFSTRFPAARAAQSAARSAHPRQKQQQHRQPQPLLEVLDI